MSGRRTLEIPGQEEMKTLLESLEIDLEQLEEEQQDNGGYEKMTMRS